MIDAYGNIVQTPLAYPQANANPGAGEYTKYQPGQHLNGLDVSCGQAQFGGGVPLGGQQGAWVKHEKYMPAMQYLQEHSGLTHASSGGSGTLNNPVHKVPKVNSSNQTC